MIKFFIELDFDIEKKIYGFYDYDILRGHKIIYSNFNKTSWKQVKHYKKISRYDADIICKFMILQQEKEKCQNI